MTRTRHGKLMRAAIRVIDRDVLGPACAKYKTGPAWRILFVGMMEAKMRRNKKRRRK